MIICEDYTRFGYTQAQRLFAEMICENYNLYKKDWDDYETYRDYAENFVKSYIDQTWHLDEGHDITQDEMFEIAYTVAKDIESGELEVEIV